MNNQIFSKLVQQDPEKIALTYQEKQITYSQLLEQVSTIANGLSKENIGQGDIVAIVMERNIPAVCAIMGVLLSGAAFCFIDKSYPSEHIRFILSDIGSKIAITEQWIKELTPFKGVFPEMSFSPDSPALVVYTSSSTDAPKGVIISHSTLEKALQGDVLKHNTQDVFFSTLSFSSVDIVRNLFVALRLGATLHITVYSPEISKAVWQEAWPLTPPEEQMAIEQSLYPESNSYNVNLGFRLRGTLDFDRLQKALDSLIVRHEAFRSYYPMEQNEFVHKIAEQLTVPIKPENCALADLQTRIDSLNTPFAIDCLPLFRCHLFDTGEDLVLHFCFHHIIIDATSGATFVEELWKLYEGKELEPLAISYTDYAVWQQQNTDTAGEAFFRNLFSDGVPENEMPLRYLRPAVLPEADQQVEKYLPLPAIKQAAKRLGVSTYALLMSAVGLTLAKYCGCQDVVLGTAMSGRNLQQLDGMLGMFVNTVPIPLKPVPTLLVHDYVLQTAQIIKQVKANQTYPFEKLVNMLAPERNSSQAPIFNVSVNYLRELPEPKVEGLQIQNLQLKRQAVRLDLALEFLCIKDRLWAELSYSPLLYQKEIVQNFLEQFACILERIIADDFQTLRQVAQLPEAQKQQILRDFAGKRLIYPEETVLNSFIRQATETPEQTAVVYKERSITYRELNQKTTAIGAYLAENYGVEPGDAVGIMVRRSEIFPLCSLGVLKTGAAYMPLDPGYPPERLSYMMQDSQAQVLIADRSLEENYANFAGRVCYTDEFNDLPISDWKPILPQPDDLMVLLYTSGTTGNPKGVVLHHQGINNYCSWFASLLELQVGDQVTAYVSFGFDGHMVDFYPALSYGACVHIIEEDMRLDLPAMLRYYDQNGISSMTLTTQMGRQFVLAMQEGNLAFEKLRSIVVAGETLVPLVPPKQVKLWNLYGPSECSVGATYFLVDRLYERVPIGYAVPNIALYVLDSQGDLAPVGVAGELHIAGIQVGRGYLNRPDLTQEKFVSNPFSSEAAYDRMYKTGDIVRFLPDGAIDFIGRRDFQVKIRGFRVELTEIEGRIRDYPGIKDATVQAIADASGGKRVVAYVVCADPVDIKKLNAFIEQTLPRYMVPSATMQIERIPLNQNGKVNRRALPEITLPAEEIVPASTPKQQLLLDIFQEILGIQIGINTDLLYAGLSSLASIRAAAKITSLTGYELKTRQLMQEKTVERIAALLDSKQEAIPEIQEKKTEYPLTSNQIGVYYECLKNPQSLNYNIPFCIALDAKTDPERLAGCVQQVIEAHPYIKTCLALREQQPVQIRRDNLAWEVPVARVSLAEFEKLQSAFVRPFKLLGDLLMRIEIYATPQKVYLLADFHHLIFDGASVDIFLRDLSLAWAGKSLESENFSAYDLALTEPKQDSGQSYFKDLLGDGEGATQIPGSNPSGVSAVANAYVNRAAIEPGLKHLGITQANLFLSAVALVISRVVGTSQARIASISNGREGVHTQELLGMLVKTLPAVISVPDEAEVSSYCLSVQSRMFDTLEQQSYSYAQVATNFNYEAQILYVYQGGVIAQHTLGGQIMEINQLIPDTLKFPISIRIYEEETVYRVEIVYDEGSFDFMPSLTQSIAYVAQTLAQNPSLTLAELAIVSPEQRRQLASFNRPLVPNTKQVLHHLFEEQALLLPNKTALIASDAIYTFDQLNQKANRLAHKLLDKGVKIGDRIAFMLPRTSEVLIAMLGIMKAGGCYIPIDPEYPADRIAHVLTHSGASYLLTSQDKLTTYSNALDIRKLAEQDSNPDLKIRAEDSCYIIYTSGSTGKPKGVEITHGNISNYVLDTPENIQVHALSQNQCIMCSVTTVSFDMFLKESFTSLMNGLTLVLADEQQANNPDKLADLINQTGATAFNATPSRMLQYLELPAMAQALGGMKVIMAGGESYPPVLLSRLRQISKATLINTYGPTEITVSCNGKLLEQDEITIGSPLFNVVEQVLDRTGNLLPVGLEGELYIGGAGVAKGYYANPEMTKAQFVKREGICYYKSGDLARWTANGEIVLLGRNDGQIKLRGLRIELGEIEQVLSKVPGIKSCVVLVKKMRGQEHLCAYYTADQLLATEMIKERLALSLTKYMVPSAYLQMDKLPTTPNGKIDRKALPDAQFLQNDDYVEPANQRELDFCQIMQNILKLERVSAAGNFFDMGGHSLLVTQLTIDAVNKGYEISYGDVFANPTPQALAALNQNQTQQIELSYDFGEYDYTALNTLLAQNTLEGYRKGASQSLGNICLTGATGFLGVHLLREYLKQETGKAYCLVRGKQAPKRLMNTLYYYFSDSFESLFGSRIIVLSGDVAEQNDFAQLDNLPIDTYINCAANVKHFSAGTDIWDINVKGIQNGIAFALRQGCRLIQISTVSVAGLNVDGALGNRQLDETMLYFGQDLSNQYVSSKFMAERLVLEACLEGLDGKIIRVGNLMARHSDGEFQMNFNTNSFLGKLKAYGLIGRMSYAQAAEIMEFAPIDYTAQAILRLAQTPTVCRVFHAFNDHDLFMSDIVEQLAQIGVPIQYCEEEDYHQAFEAALADPNKASNLRALIAYKNLRQGQVVLPVKAQNQYTNQILLRQNFHWPITSQAYLKQFFSMMQGLGVFDDAK